MAAGLPPAPSSPPLPLPSLLPSPPLPLPLPSSAEASAALLLLLPAAWDALAAPAPRQVASASDLQVVDCSSPSELQAAPAPQAAPHTRSSARCRRRAASGGRTSVFTVALPPVLLLGGCTVGHGLWSAATAPRATPLSGAPADPASPVIAPTRITTMNEWVSDSNEDVAARIACEIGLSRRFVR